MSLKPVFIANVVAININTCPSLSSSHFVLRADPSFTYYMSPSLHNVCFNNSNHTSTQNPEYSIFIKKPPWLAVKSICSKTDQSKSWSDVSTSNFQKPGSRKFLASFPPCCCLCKLLLFTLLVVAVLLFSM